MTVEPELDKRARLWIRQINFADGLERRDGGLGGVRDDTVNHLKPIDVRLVFLIAAESIKDGLGQEKKQICEEKQRWKRSPIIYTTKRPSPLSAIQRAPDRHVNQHQHHDYQSPGECYAFGYMPEHVVAHLVSDYEYGLWQCHLCDGG